MDDGDIVVTGNFPAAITSRYATLELVTAPCDPSRLGFQILEDGRMKFVRSLKIDGSAFVAPDATSRSWPRLVLPEFAAEERSNSDDRSLSGDIESCISEYVELQPAAVPIITSILLASWFPEAFEMAPLLWLVGPLGSAKTKLLRLLSCFTRRSLVVGDVSAGSLYQMTDTFAPTLIIDELEDDGCGRTDQIYKFLRLGTSPGAQTLRNGRKFSVFGFKLIASRQPSHDQALMSRAVVIPMLPTAKDLKPLPDTELDEIARRFQPRLLRYRLSNRENVSKFCLPEELVKDLTPRARQMARTLSAPLEQDPERTRAVLDRLAAQDQAAKVDRSLEPEWLVAESLFRLSHRIGRNGSRWSEITVGGVANDINYWLKWRGETLRLSPKKVGVVMASLGIQTERLGNLGRGLRASTALFRKFHEVARSLGIDRRTTSSPTGLEHRIAGPTCDLCQEFGLTGGLVGDDSENTPGTGLRRISGSAGPVSLTRGARRFHW